MAAPLTKRGLLKLSDKELLKRFKIKKNWKETKIDWVGRILQSRMSDNFLRPKRRSSNVSSASAPSVNPRKKRNNGKRKKNKKKAQNSKKFPLTHEKSNSDTYATKRNIRNKHSLKANKHTTNIHRQLSPLLISQSKTDIVSDSETSKNNPQSKGKQPKSKQKKKTKHQKNKPKKKQTKKPKTVKKPTKPKKKQKTHTKKPKKQRQKSHSPSQYARVQSQSQSPLPTLYQLEDKSFSNQSFPEYLRSLSNSSTHSKNHRRSISIIQIVLQAPRRQYKISDIRLFDTVKDIKIGLKTTHGMNITPEQCKLFHNGRELNDDRTLADLNLPNTAVRPCKFQLLISWKSFKPDQSLPHPKTIEHEHMMDTVSELKTLNQFTVFEKLLCGIMRGECVELAVSEQKLIQTYCECLSGDRTYERKWTALHSMVYDYQNDLSMVTQLLKDTCLYIDAWPHSGNDTPLKMAINRCIPNKCEEQKVNELNADGAVELVQFLVLNGARRMVRPTIANLERKINDHLYGGMDEGIRMKLIRILEPYVDEDPYKPVQ